jgi:hypothetical protein
LRIDKPPDNIRIVVDLDGSEDPILLVEVFTPLGSLQLLGRFEIGNSSSGMHIWVVMRP